jgi:hypothetical protein
MSDETTMPVDETTTDTPVVAEEAEETTEETPEVEEEEKEVTETASEEAVA